MLQAPIWQAETPVQEIPTSVPALPALTTALTMTASLSKLNILVDQVSTKSQTVNVYNNPCNTNKVGTIDSKASQTDVITPTVAPQDEISMIEIEEANVRAVPHCKICSKTLRTVSELDEHIELVHGATNLLSTDVACDYCDAKLSSEQILHEHISKKHATSFLQCPKCKFRSQLKTQLVNHLKECHTTEPDQNVKTKQIHQPVILDKSTGSSSESL